MAPIVAPDICRFAVNQTLGGQPVVNILDMSLTAFPGEVTREQACYDTAGDIINNWSEHIQAFQVNDLVANSVSWLDLNSLDGTRGERTSTDTYAWPREGRNVTDSVMPSVVAARVDKATTGGRGTKSGRMYLSGIPEQWTDVGVSISWSAATQASINAFLDAFLEGINNVAGPDLEERNLVVIHTRDGEYASASGVSSLTLNPLVSTQVRRGALR